MRLLMLPDNAPAALESLAHMVDEVWYHAGDTSTDVCIKILCQHYIYELSFQIDSIFKDSNCR